MTNHIAAQLKALKRVRPHPALMAHGRTRLLAALEPRITASPWRSLEWAGALTFALMFLFVATFSLPAKPTLSASLNEELLSGELAELPINIELQELTYRASTERTLESAIAEITETEGAHLNSSVLSSEFSSLEAASSSSDIDVLLDKVLE